MQIKLSNPRLYLASRSPRRRELLAQIGIQFDTIVFRDAPREDRELDETPQAGEAPIDYVRRVARAWSGVPLCICTLASSRYQSQNSSQMNS